MRRVRAFLGFLRINYRSTRQPDKTGATDKEVRAVPSLGLPCPCLAESENKTRTSSLSERTGLPWSVLVRGTLQGYSPIQRACLVAGTLFLATPILHAAEYHVDTTATRLVKFISQAPLENFEGVTSRIDGYALIPSDALEAGKGPDSSRFYFEVDLNALDTGIGLRNRHMRENYFETEKYPFAQFAGSIPDVSRESDTSLSVLVSGEMTIHGVKRPLQATIRAGTDGRWYHVHGQFPISLPDYLIKIPKLMFMKISDTVQVQLDFYLLPVSGSKEGK